MTLEEEQIFDLIKSKDFEIRRLGITMLKNTKFYKSYYLTKISRVYWGKGYCIKTFINDFFHDIYWSHEDIVEYCDLIKRLWIEKEKFLQSPKKN